MTQSYLITTNITHLTTSFTSTHHSPLHITHLTSTHHSPHHITHLYTSLTSTHHSPLHITHLTTSLTSPLHITHLTSTHNTHRDTTTHTAKPQHTPQHTLPPDFAENINWMLCSVLLVRRALEGPGSLVC